MEMIRQVHLRVIRTKFGPKVRGLPYTKDHGRRAQLLLLTFSKA